MSHFKWDIYQPCVLQWTWTDQTDSNSLRTAPGLPSVVQSYAITALRRLVHMFFTTFFTWGIRHKLCIVGFFLEASDGWATTSNEISERLMGWWDATASPSQLDHSSNGDVVSSSISVRSVHQQSCFAGMDYSTTRRILKRYIESDKMVCFFHLIVVLWWFYDGFGCHHRWPFPAGPLFAGAWPLRCRAGLPQRRCFFFGGHNELGGYMVTGLLITPHNWDELGYTCLLNVTNHLANLATSKVKDQPVSALRVKFVEHYNWF